MGASRQFVSAGTVAGPRGHRVRAPEAGAAGGATESVAAGAKRGAAGSLARGAAEGVAEGEALLGRPRVIALFGQAAQNPLVTVTAGPGYGKTCAVREFLGVAPSARAVWADCDPQGGVPAFFWRAVAGAARGEFSGSPAKPEGAGLPGGAGESGARSRSAEEAPSAESPVYYVADGYEFGASAATDRRLGQAAALMPRHSSIIAIGRRSARLGLSGLKCGMGEISARDLAFTAEEARLLFELHGRRISPGRAAEITDFTEGWALALRLLLRGGDQAAGLGGRGAGANPAQLSALFESEYYAEYGAGVRLMLSRLSLLPEFTLDIARRALLAGGQSAGARGKRGAGGNSDESGANCENGEGGAKGIGGAGGAGGKSGAKDSVSHAKGGAGGNSDESGVNCENGEGGEGCVAGPRGGAPAEADEAAGVVEAVEAADVADVVAAAVTDAVEEGEGIDAADVAEATATADVAEAAEITEIAEAIRANPFIGYDGRSGLYFFHGMYRAFLAERLPMPGEGEQRRLWRGAGGAFLEAGHFARAAGCYARGGAYGMALESMCRHIGASAGITRETAARFEEMLERLPPGYGDQNPLAGYVRAQIDLNRLDAGRAFGRLADAESRLNALPPGERPEFWPELLGDIYYTMGLARLMQNDASFPEYFRKASGLLPNGSPLRAPRKLCLGSNSVLALGDSAPGALRRMEEAVREAAPHFTRVAKGGGSGYACLFSAEAAYSTLDFGAARQNSYRAIFEAEEARQHDIACGARVILAKIALMAGAHDEFFEQVDCVQRGADSPRGALREGLGAASGGIGWRGAVSGRAPGERISAGRAPAERTPAERAAALGWAAGRPPAPGAAGLDPAQGATGRAPGQAPGPQRAAATGAPEIAPAPGLASALAPAAAALASAPKSASAPGLPGYAPAPGAPARLTAPELSPAPGLPRHAPAPESPKRPPAPKPSLAPERLPAPELSPAPRLRGHAPAPGAPARPPAPEFSPAPYAPAMDDLREFALNWMYLKMGDLKALTPWIAEHGAASCGSPPIMRGRDRLLYACCLNRAGRYDELLALLDGVESFCARRGLWIGRLDVHIIRAVAFSRLRDEARAMQSLRRAYDMSHGNGIIAPFVEAGGYMRALADSARRRGCDGLDAGWLDCVHRKSYTYAKKLSAVSREYFRRKELNPAALPGGACLGAGWGAGGGGWSAVGDAVGGAGAGFGIGRGPGAPAGAGAGQRGGFGAPAGFGMGAGAAAGMGAGQRAGFGMGYGPGAAARAGQQGCAGAPLSKRETEILRHLSQGLTRRDIADADGISVNTAKSVITNVYNKLGAINKADAVRIAASMGLIG